MNNPHDKNTERLRRIRKVTENAEAAASAAEPTADVITQKIVQEIAELKRQRDALAKQVKEMQQQQQEQQAALKTLKGGQQQIVDYLKRRKEPEATEQSCPSLADIDARILDKLHLFKVQLACAVVVIGLAVAAFLFWPERDEPEPQPPTSTHLPGGWGQ